MSTYDITLTDPLKPGFTIQPGGFDGPGGAKSNTTMRLYGRGALEWGEAVDENLARLTETFAGSTPPLNPNAGQLWMCVRYYAHDTSQGNLAGWWQYNLTTHVWAPIDGSANLAGGVVSNTAPTNPSIGSYYYNITDGVLYRWDTAYKQAAAAWMPRSFTATNLNAVAPVRQPEHTLLVWNSNAAGGDGAWVSPLTVAVNLTAPGDPQVGTIWYDQTTGKLKIWNGTAWVNILGPSGTGSQSMSTDLNMNMFNILNVHDTTINGTNTNAVNARTVYNYVTQALSDLSTALTNSSNGTYLKLTGGTLSGALQVNSNLGVTGTATIAAASITNATIAGTATVGTVSTTNLSVGSNANMNSHKIINVANPTASGDAVNKAYLDSTIGGLGLSGLTSNNIARTNYGGAAHDGDIRTSAPNIVEIYCNGRWVRVFPAQWAG